MARNFKELEEKMSPESRAHVKAEVQRLLDEMAVDGLRALPSVIETEQENERMIAELENLDTRDRPLTPNEEKLAEAMTALIQQFEEKHYPLGHPKPLEVLRSLIEARSLPGSHFRLCPRGI